MKHAKQLFANTKQLIAENGDQDITPILWELICYAPKMSPRLNQQQLLDDAKKFTLSVFDPHFANANLNFNGFIWGDGSRKILLTHGWGSKAADFTELITELRQLPDVQIIAFDAPGNGSSEGYLSNMLLFIKAVDAVIAAFGKPDIVIGHSLGAISNVAALGAAGIKPELVISLAPMMRLKENFAATMDAVGVSATAKKLFFEDFKDRFGNDIATINWEQLYKFEADVPHWIAYNPNDAMVPDAYLQEFLASRPYITAKAFDAPHERMMRDAEVIRDVVGLVGNKS